MRGYAHIIDKYFEIHFKNSTKSFINSTDFYVLIVYLLLYKLLLIIIQFYIIYKINKLENLSNLLYNYYNIIINKLIYKYHSRISFYILFI